jgi:DNA-binding CsgD family transcriptional regulator
MTDPGARRVGRSFGILYLSRYALAVLIIPYNIFIGIPQPFRLLTGFGAMLVFNLFPLVWYRTVFIRYAECIGRQFEGTGALERIFARYSISRREQEIMRLLIEGKSNREIADTLFIALPTVKNHVHNIYQKLKVSSRYGLIHRVMPFRKEGT